MVLGGWTPLECQSANLDLSLSQTVVLLPLVSGWLNVGHVTQLWPMRSGPERLLGKFSSFLKKKKPKRPSASGIWVLLGKNVMLRAVVAIL